MRGILLEECGSNRTEIYPPANPGFANYYLGRDTSQIVSANERRWPGFRTRLDLPATCPSFQIRRLAFLFHAQADVERTEPVSL